MRTFAFAIIAGLICLVPAASSDAASLIDFVGFSWETGGFPDSVNGLLRPMRENR